MELIGGEKKRMTTARVEGKDPSYKVWKENYNIILSATVAF